MVSYRKPVKLSDDIIDRRPLRKFSRKGYEASLAAAKLDAELLEEAIFQAMELRKKRPR